MSIQPPENLTVGLERGLSILVHGYAGVGKSTFGVSGPLPRLIMDVENSSRFIMQRKIPWDPMTQPPPVWDGSWELCVVKIKTWEIAKRTMDWLKSGDHPFKSVSVDSISELQIKSQNTINSDGKMQVQHWGQLLQNMGTILRELRDLIGEDNNSIETMVLVSTSKLNEKGSLVPYLQGGIAAQVPYLFDMTGYYYVDQIPNTTTGELESHRVLFTGVHPLYEAKSRSPMMPETILDPNLTDIMNNLFPEPQVQQQAPVQ